MFYYRIDNIDYEIRYEHGGYWLYVDGEKTTEIPRDKVEQVIIDKLYRVMECERAMRDADEKMDEEMKEIILGAVCMECGGVGTVEVGRYDDIIERACPECEGSGESV